MPVIKFDALWVTSSERREIYCLDPEIYTFIPFIIRAKLIPCTYDTATTLGKLTFTAKCCTYKNYECNLSYL